MGNTLFGNLPKGVMDRGGFPQATEAGKVICLIAEGVNGRALSMVVGHAAQDYGFSLERFSAADREWLVEVVGKQIEEAYRQGFAEGTAYVREPIKAALGIKT